MMPSASERRILQLERQNQELAESIRRVENQRSTIAKPGGRPVVLEATEAITGRTKNGTGDYTFSSGDATLVFVYESATAGEYQGDEVINGSSVKRNVVLVNLSEEAVETGQLVPAISSGAFYYYFGSGGVSAIHARTKAGGIPARSTLTMGSANCDIYNSSGAGVLSDSTTDETIYNMAASAVAETTHIVASRNAAGLLVVIVEDCA